MAFHEMKMYLRIFQMFGVWYSVPKDIKGTLGFIAQIVRNGFFTVSWFAVAASVYKEGFRQSMSGNAFYLIVALVTIIEMIIFFVKRQDTHNIMHTLEMSVNNRKIWEKEFFKGRAVIASKVMTFYYITMVSMSVFMYVGVPLLNEILELYGIEPLTVAEPFGEFTNHGPDKGIVDKVLFWAGMIWCLCGITFYAGVHSAFFTFTLYTSAEIDLICEKIRRLSYIDDVDYYRMDKIKLTADEISLREIIEHHQFVLKQSKKLIDFFGFIFAVENTVAAFGICLNLITLRFTLKDAGSGVLIITGLTILSNLIQLTATCYFGNYLTERGNLLYIRLYELPWYSLPPFIRKTISIMLGQASRPTVINFRGLAPISLVTYSQLMNAAFSYFTVISSLLNE